MCIFYFTSFFVFLDQRKKVKSQRKMTIANFVVASNTQYWIYHSFFLHKFCINTNRNKKNERERKKGCKTIKCSNLYANDYSKQLWHVFPFSFFSILPFGALDLWNKTKYMWVWFACGMRITVSHEWQEGFGTYLCP